MLPDGDQPLSAEKSSEKVSNLADAAFRYVNCPLPFGTAPPGAASYPPG